MKPVPELFQRDYELRRGEIIALTPSKAAVLSRDGRVPWSASRLPPVARRGFAFDGDISSALWFDSHHDLALVLRSIRVVVRAEGGARVLELSEEAPFDALLERAAAMVRAEATSSTIDDGSHRLHVPSEVERRYGVRVPAIPIVGPAELAGWVRIAHRHVLVPRAIEALSHGRDHMGLLSRCSCGIVACESLWMWSVGGLARCIVRVEGSRISSVQVMPFMIDPST